MGQSDAIGQKKSVENALALGWRWPPALFKSFACQTVLLNILLKEWMKLAFLFQKNFWATAAVAKAVVRITSRQNWRELWQGHSFLSLEMPYWFLNQHLTDSCRNSILLQNTNRTIVMRTTKLDKNTMFIATATKSCTKLAEILLLQIFLIPQTCPIYFLVE